MNIDPDILKLELRRKAFIQEINCPSTSYAQACERSFKLWTSYENINRDFCPNDPVYSIAQSGGLVTTKDACAYGSAGTGQARIMDIMMGGIATASSVVRLAAQRCNAFLAAGTTLGGSVGFFSDMSPFPSGIFTNAGTQALQGNPALLFAFNGWNGAFRWVAPPQQEIYVVNGERFCLRPSSGSASVGVTMVVEEL